MYGLKLTNSSVGLQGIENSVLNFTVILPLARSTLEGATQADAEENRWSSAVLDLSIEYQPTRKDMLTGAIMRQLLMESDQLPPWLYLRSDSQE